MFDLQIRVTKSKTAFPFFLFHSLHLSIVSRVFLSFSFLSFSFSSKALFDSKDECVRYICQLSSFCLETFIWIFGSTNRSIQANVTLKIFLFVSLPFFSCISRKNHPHHSWNENCLKRKLFFFVVRERRKGKKMMEDEEKLIRTERYRVQNLLISYRIQFSVIDGIHITKALK